MRYCIRKTFKCNTTGCASSSPPNRMIRGIHLDLNAAYKDLEEYHKYCEKCKCECRAEVVEKPE